MKLKNVMIVVKNMEQSKKFYHDLFGLDVILDQGSNVIMTEGLVLQEESVWKEFLGKEVIPNNHACELYFEESNLESFIEKMERLYPSVQYISRLTEYDWGKKIVRFYDLDGNMLEVGTP